MPIIRNFILEFAYKMLEVYLNINCLKNQRHYTRLQIFTILQPFRTFFLVEFFTT